MKTQLRLLAFLLVCFLAATGFSSCSDDADLMEWTYNNPENVQISLNPYQIDVTTGPGQSSIVFTCANYSDLELVGGYDDGAYLTTDIGTFTVSGNKLTCDLPSISDEVQTRTVSFTIHPKDSSKSRFFTFSFTRNATNP